MSRSALATDLANVLDAEVTPAVKEALAHLEKIPVNILDPDDPNVAVLDVLRVLSAIEHRLASPEIAALVRRARGTE